jgi:uncharacterized protein YbjT (DUF2867 family)/uncharacterized protein YndB with AHSA1/START domain
MGLHVLVTGATGYIGGRLVPELLDAGHRARCLARSPAKLEGRPWSDHVEVVKGDLADRRSLDEAMVGVDAAYFLVHGMGSAADFAARDREGAAAFRDAAARAGVRQIIYLGGLGEDPGDGRDRLSEHLSSRHEVGATLAAGPVPVTELRAAVIIGSGSASFEMLRNLTDVLPVMITPRWVRTRCQPIAIRDVLTDLVGVLGRPEAYGRVFEVGGPDVVTYQEMMALYADIAGLRRRLLIPVPLLSPRLSSLWVGLVTPLPGKLARPLVESLRNEVVVHDRAIDDVVPHRYQTLRQAIAGALERTRDLEVTTSWAGAELPGRHPADPMPTDPHWSGGLVLDDTQIVTTPAPVEQVFRAVCGVGGRRGWYAAEPLWELRGALDRLIGGPGMRRGRRHPDELRVGDTVDFFRVEALVPDRLVRLRAEMRVPGEAWLEWTLDDPGDGTTVLVQKARFHPRGVWGRAYWYAMLPFHHLIFRRLAQHLAAPRASDEAAGGVVATNDGLLRTGKNERPANHRHHPSGVAGPAAGQ